MTDIDQTKLTGITLSSGSHDDPTEGLCLMEAARASIRFRADGALAKGQPSWVRVFGRCELRGDCWVFTGGTNENGYGAVRHDGRMVGAHRVAWETVNSRATPVGLDVCHTCDNPPCCNPAHLFLGTHAENNADRHAKGRTVMPSNGPDFWRNKTHCPQGHPYDGDNVRLRPNGSRRCAQCYRDRASAYAAANRDAMNARKRAARAAKRSA